MDQVYTQELTITPSLSDADGRLGLYSTFGVCMDIAAIHAQQLGIGVYELAKRDLFWLTVKTQLRFFDRPRMMECVTAKTWPDQPGKLRGNRSYQILRNDMILISGKTEWAVINQKTNQLSRMDDVYPAQMEFTTPSALPEPFARILDDFDSEPTYAQYAVRSTDIDIGGHMNNTAYVRTMLGSLSNEALRGMNIRQIDIVFRSPCFEGDTLQLQRRKKENCLEIRMSKHGETAFLARIE